MVVWMGNETDFDTALQLLAARLIDEEAPGLQDRLWNEDSLVNAMRTYVAIKSDQPSAALLATCEAMGRAKLAMAREYGQA